MAVVNAIGLLDNSPFRDTSQVPLPKDLPVDDQGEESEEEGDDSPGMRELSEQIDANVMVLDEENQSSVTLTKAQNIPQSTPSSAIPDTTTVPETSTADPQDPSL